MYGQKGDNICIWEAREEAVEMEGKGQVLEMLRKNKGQDLDMIQMCGAKE